MLLNALTRTTEHSISTVTIVLDGTMIILKTAVNMTMKILRPMRCAAPVKLWVYVFYGTSFHLTGIELFKS